MTWALLNDKLMRETSADEARAREAWVKERLRQSYVTQRQRALDEHSAEQNPDFATQAITRLTEESAPAPVKPETAAPVKDTDTEEEGPGVVGTAKDVGYAVAHGAASMVDETLEFGSDVAELFGMEDTGDITWFRRLTGTEDAPDTGAGQAVAGIVQFISAYALPGGMVMKGGQLLMRGAKAAKGAEAAAEVGKTTLKGMMARGAVADAVAFDPHQARLSTLLNDVPVLEPVVSDWMAAANPDDPSWEGRVKNAIEGLALGIPAELLYKGLRRAVGLARSGRPEKASVSPDNEALKAVAERSAVEAETAAEAALVRREAINDTPTEDEYIELLHKAGRPAEEIIDRAEKYAMARLGIGQAPAGKKYTKAEREALDEAAPEVEGARDAVVAHQKARYAVWESKTTGEAAVKWVQNPRTVAASPEGMMVDLVQARGIATDLGLSDYQRNALGASAFRAVQDLMAVPQFAPNKRVGEAYEARKAAAERLLTLYRADIGRKAAKMNAADTPALSKPDADMDRWYDQAARDWGRQPILEAHRPDMARGKYAAPRFVGVKAMRDARPKDYGAFDADKRNAANRPAEMETLGVPMAYKLGARYKPDKPVTVFFEDVNTLDDLDGLIDSVGRASGEVSGAGAQASAHRSLRALLIDRLGFNAFSLREMPEGQSQATLEALLASGDTLHRLAMMAADGASSPEVRVQFVRAMLKTQALAHRAAGDLPYAKQLLKDAETPLTVTDAEDMARKLWRHRTLKAEGNQHIHAFAGIFANAGDLGQLFGMLRGYKTPRSQLAAMTETAGKYIARPAREVWVNGVLSSPATHARNIVGNTLPPLIQIPEHFIAGLSDRGGMFSRRAWVDTTREIGSMIAGFNSGWRDAWYLANQSRKLSMAQKAQNVDAVSAVYADLKSRGMDTMFEEFIRQVKVDDATRLSNAGSTGLLPDAVLEMSEGHPWSKAAHVMDTFTRQAINTPVAMLQAEDVFMKTLTYRMEIARRATNQAMSEGLKGDALRARVVELKGKPPEDLQMASINKAHYNTFTQDLPSWGQKSLDWLNIVPGARYVVPFFKTPTNIALMAGEYTPGVNRLYKSYQNAIATGGREAAQARAKTKVGMGILGISMALAYQGKISGGDPTNPDFRATARSLGRKEYAYRTDDGEWVDYRFVGGPFGLIMSVGADLGMYLSAMETEEEINHGAALAQTMAFAVGSVVNETYLGQLAEFVDMVAVGGVNKQAFDRFAANTARGWVPFSAMTDDVRQVLQTMGGGSVTPDTRIREGLGGKDEPFLSGEHFNEAVRGAMREMMRPLSWWGDQGKTKRNLFGDPITYYRPRDGGGVSFGEAAGAAYSPLAFHQELDDPLSQKMLEIKVPLPRIKDTHVVRYAEGAAEVTGVLEMPDEVMDYIEVRAGKLFKQRGTAHVNLKGFDELSVAAQQGAIQHEWEQARKLAKREAVLKFPEFQRSIAAEKLRLRDKARGQQ